MEFPLSGIDAGSGYYRHNKRIRMWRSATHTARYEPGRVNDRRWADACDMHARCDQANGAIEQNGETAVPGMNTD